MGKTVAIGIQDFADLRAGDYFYIDKSGFIADWWKSGDDVTLITRPRRFGKTLNMSMVNAFFSLEYKERGEELFSGLKIWSDPGMRMQQGMWPVIFLSFAGIKYKDFKTAKAAIGALLEETFSEYKDIVDYQAMGFSEKRKYDSVCEEMADHTASTSINYLCALLEKKYGRKAIVLLDEYDTPMQEAWINGYWDEMVAFIRALFNNTFKTNTHLARGLMTGITRISKESIFSDLNNLTVVTTTSGKYETAFGFTEKEVFDAMDYQGMDPENKKDVKTWYDGFSFGDSVDIYNPWSITCYLDEKKLNTWWADTSSNSLIGSLLRTGDPELKQIFEALLAGESIKTTINEQIVFSQLDGNNNAVWSLLLAAGYLKAVHVQTWPDGSEPEYTLGLTNLEVRIMFRDMIKGWFTGDSNLSPFIKAMLLGDIRQMNAYMNRIALTTFSSFDSGTHPSETAPERFYHGFVLGLLVDKAPDYVIKSNRESGYGRYDVVMEPKEKSAPAVIMEFKVLSEYDEEKELADTVANALKQIEEKHYDSDLIERGIPADRIYKYGFAFEGNRCLIGK